MSVVSTVILICDGDGEANVDIIQAWLSDRGKAKLAKLNSSFSGSKHPRIDTYGGAYNMFNNEEFVNLFMSLDWESEEGALLVIRPQDDGILTYRPARSVT